MCTFACERVYVRACAPARFCISARVFCVGVGAMCVYARACLFVFVFARVSFRVRGCARVFSCSWVRACVFVFVSVRACLFVLMSVRAYVSQFYLWKCSFPFFKFQILRTVKFLSAISVCHHVVRTDWLKESYKQNSFLGNTAHPNTSLVCTRGTSADSNQPILPYKLGYGDDVKMMMTWWRGRRRR